MRMLVFRRLVAILVMFSERELVLLDCVILIRLNKGIVLVSHISELMVCSIRTMDAIISCFLLTNKLISFSEIHRGWT